ncbi:MAG TPA: GNAT family protein [Candidatus Limnocylindria bacterium]|nr:GNAT family protein [Candidatus Limnocylindria bacterium]
MKPPQRVTLSGNHVRLEPIEERHRDDLLAAAVEDPDTFRYTLSQLWKGAEAWPAYLADALRREYVTWATVLCADGRAIGSTRFGDISAYDGRLEIGWTWIAPSQQRTAANTEAKLLQLTYAFDELGATRVALKTDARNERSQRAIERIGGVREGVLRRHMRLPDGFVRDTVFYSILSDEWPVVKRGLTERLAR